MEYEQQEQDQDNRVRMLDSYHTDSIMKLRLDTDKVLKDIQAYLEGHYEAYTTTEDGNIVLKKVVFGEKKCNQKGVQGIIAFVRSIFNPQTVQGNFVDMARYDSFIKECDIKISKMVWVNMFNWEVQIQDYDPICDYITGLMIPFMSRLIQNKERESYGRTFQTHESVMHQPQQKRSLFNMFGGKR